MVILHCKKLIPFLFLKQFFGVFLPILVDVMKTKGLLYLKS